jgi:GNAT superfamily N-acetyltransferase
MIQCIGLNGSDVRPYIDDLAKLRCEVFREYPYLYRGDLEYEREYLAHYTESQRAFLVIAKFQDQIVGVSTCMAMQEADPAFQAPFIAAGYDLEKICYFGESVLLPEFRGHGVGHRFFDLREKWANSQQLSIHTFCAVLRPDQHPARPVDYRPQDTFWTKRGYIKHDHLFAELEWPEVGGTPDACTQHQLVFWLNPESGRPYP